MAIDRHELPPAGGDDALHPELLANPAMLWAGREAWARVARCEPSIGRTLLRVVLPFAGVPPLMMLYAVRVHPQVFGLAADGRQWEWLAVALLLAECATVWLMGLMLHVVPAEDRARPSREQAFLLAALAAAPLWGSAVILLVPSIAAVLVGFVLGQAASVRMLCLGLQALRPAADELEGMHLAIMTQSTALVVWVLLFGLFLISMVMPAT